MDLASLAWVCPGNRSFAGPSCLSSYSCRVAWFAPRKYGRARVACFLGGACRIRVRIASRGQSVQLPQRWGRIFSTHHATPTRWYSATTSRSWDADAYDVQVAIHTDTINEAGFVEDTLAAIAGRTIHTYNTEGAGGGHAPDIIPIAPYS